MTLWYSLSKRVSMASTIVCSSVDQLELIWSICSWILVLRDSILFLTDVRRAICDARAAMTSDDPPVSAWRVVISASISAIRALRLSRRFWSCSRRVDIIISIFLYDFLYLIFTTLKYVNLKLCIFEVGCIRGSGVKKIGN